MFEDLVNDRPARCQQGVCISFSSPSADQNKDNSGLEFSKMCNVDDLSKMIGYGRGIMHPSNLWHEIKRLLESYLA